MIYMKVDYIFSIRVALDTLELGNAVIDDLNDADKKIGKKTGMALAKICGRWVEAVIGAELGLAGGIAGAIG